MSGSNRNTLETLESRQLLAVTLSNFTVSDAVVVAGQNLTLSVDALASTPDGSIFAATFFNDVNNNGIWNAGTDIDLGASFTPATGNTFRKTIAVPVSWTGTINIVADAVSNLGNWSAGRQQNSVRVNPRPTITTFTISSNSFDLITPLTLTTVVGDDTSVRAVTWFLDRDLNGRFTPGVDTSLATSFTPDTGTTYSTMVTANSTWPQVAQILTDVQDNDLDWAAAALDVTTTQTVQTRPTVTNLVALTRYASIGPGAIRLLVNASDNSAVHLTTFFIDLDNNGGWSPFFDQDLGLIRMTSQSATYTFDKTTDFAGLSSVQFAADAQDFDGLYSSSRALFTLNNDIVGVTNFETAFNSNLGGGVRLFDSSFSILAPTTFGRSGTQNVNYNVFVDVNGDGLYNAGSDTVVATSAQTLTRGTASTFTPQLTIPATVVGTPRLAIFVTDAAGTSEISASHTAANRADLSTNFPAITSQAVTVGTASIFAVPGASYSVAGNWVAPAGGSFVTLFWDKNSNGRWDVGTDTDLGFATVSGTSGTYSFNGTIISAMVGYGQFATAVRDASARTNDEWSSPYTAGATQIFRAPTVSNGASASGTAGSSIAVDFDATDDFGIRAVSGFVDSNGNGLFDAGEGSTSGAAYSPLSGTRVNGRWRLVVNTTGLATGTYTVYVAANDFYRGDATAPGGTTTGFWSSRLAITLTLT